MSCSRAVWLCLVVLPFLVVCLLGVRTSQSTKRPLGGATWGDERGTSRAWWAARIAVLLALGPLLRALPFLLFSAHPLLIADASSHAAIAQDLARNGVPHGWIATYDGGFPLAVNYPPLSWCLAAALIRFGLSTSAAVQMLGTLPYVAIPFIVVEIGRRAGARPTAATLGAIMMAWISPYNFWLGTERSFLGLGLLSQSLGVLFVVCATNAILNPKGSWSLAVWGSLLAASHPQITAAFCVALFPFFAFGNRALRLRLVVVLAAIGITGVALYGPGLAALRLPFAWISTGANWWILGYRVERLYRWFVEYELFDLEGGAPAVTSIVLFALLVLAVRIRRRIPAAVLVEFAWVMSLTMCGRFLTDLGAVGTHLLGFLQPQRAFALLPFALAALVTTAWEELASIAEQLELPASRRKIVDTTMLAMPSVIVAGVALVAIPRTVDWMNTRTRVARETFAGIGTCGPMPSALPWVRDIDGRRPGRLSSLETLYYTGECFKFSGVELESPVPLGLSRGAGAHVGVLSVGFSSIPVIDPEDGKRIAPATDLRAESMGVRWLLYGVKDRPIGAWKILGATPEIELAERIGGTDTVGVGCVQERWRGSDGSLRDALFDDLQHAGAILADPNQLIALDETGGELTKQLVSTGDCDASHATVAEKRREPGAYEADIDSPSPVDVVIRATAFPTWVIRIDGVPAPVTVVAPGFPSARMPAGKHHVEAVVSPPRFYWAGVFLGALVIAGLAFETHRRMRKSGQI